MRKGTTGDKLSPCRRKTDGGREKELAHLWKEKKITKKARAGRGQEIKWEIPVKTYYTIALWIVSIILVVALLLVKRSDNAQHDFDVGTITDYSNQLDTAQTQIALLDGKFITLSNTLADCTSAALALSNQLAAAQFTNAIQSGQIGDLNQQITTTALENKALGRSSSFDKRFGYESSFRSSFGFDRSPPSFLCNLDPSYPCCANLSFSRFDLRSPYPTAKRSVHQDSIHFLQIPYISVKSSKTAIC